MGHDSLISVWTMEINGLDIKLSSPLTQTDQNDVILHIFHHMKIPRNIRKKRRVVIKERKRPWKHGHDGQRRKQIPCPKSHIFSAFSWDHREEKEEEPYVYLSPLCWCPSTSIFSTKKKGKERFFFLLFLFFFKDVMKEGMGWGYIKYEIQRGS